MDRPAATDEVADADERDDEQDEPEAARSAQLDLPVGEKPHHRSCNGAIGEWNTQLSHSIGATRMRHASRGS
jgi:hypothetical protein